MAKSKAKVVITGYNELIKNIEDLGGNVTNAIIEAVELSGRNATNRYHTFIKEHERTGITEQAIVDNPKAEIVGDKVILQTGFDVARGGAPAIWLDRGRPNQTPTKFIGKIKKDKAVSGAIGYKLGQKWKELMK